MVSIPFNRAALVGNEKPYMEAALLSGRIMGNGEYTRRCEILLSRLTRTKHALLTTSCTSALEMAALLLDLAPGDEVIVPSFAFVSTANAFVVHGATPVFADIRPDTLNLDEKGVEAHITKRTRAIVALHYGGVACEMGVLSEIAQRHGLLLIEDNAHGLSGAYHGHALGSFGHLAALSFHETKNYTCGEGGALLINEEAFRARAEILREKGTNRQAFFRGEVDKYSWVDLGSSYVVSDILAAMLLAQLECFEQIFQKRRCLWERYRTGLASWAEARGVQMPVVPAHCQQAYHLFYLLMPSEALRDRFIEYMRDHGIHVVFHYLPLHLSQMGRRFGGQGGDCPVTESACGRLVRLPLYYGLKEEEQQHILQTVADFTW
ncbi:MAG TPA: dTDP-4-amino-4,6-dideoxygalactose transaminase [Candidatus Hydrogenedentes bacterium]|nr:MAG: dTDP-4-amino-4,6-dideoxygalactose transaminase [Candidatus Hydrogenedentes bacterium ADurb.Bin101]HOC68829.1 dTDP-4-amino-4,6-dideoxygalactose transaminase [Candidatus Hydrogenedentota bacterium]HQM99628.1 dTDP-4-amino-4,6-dideoxygalactose transaminase [Candidatus Hydrogenedentota bacterium]